MRHLPCVLLALTTTAFAATGLLACSDEPAPTGETGARPSPSAAAAPDPAPSSTASATPSASSAPAPDGGGPPVSCASRPGKAGDSMVTVDVGGQPRASRLHVPSSYSASKGAMLVMNFHGLMSDPFQQEQWSKMVAASDKHGFIAAHPEGIGNSWNAGICCGTAASSKVDDVAFVKALLAKLQSDYCIDDRAIHATGMSNGGHFSYRLACTMSDVFASVAPVAGQLLEPTCNPSRPIPVLHIHGTSDTIVAYDESGGYRSVAESLAVFQQRYGCMGATKKQWFQKGDATCTSFDGCSAEVAHCRVEGGGHTWPGGIPIIIFGKTSTDLDATETIVDFFKKHRR